LQAICDLSYAMQAEQIERMALTQMTLAPHMEDSSGVLTPDGAVNEFNQWLAEKPATATPEQVEKSDLLDLIKGGR
jgi:hypothetical protein